MPARPAQRSALPNGAMSSSTPARGEPGSHSRPSTSGRPSLSTGAACKRSLSSSAMSCSVRAFAARSAGPSGRCERVADYLRVKLSRPCEQSGDPLAHAGRSLALVVASSRSRSGVSVSRASTGVVRARVRATKRVTARFPADRCRRRSASYGPSPLPLIGSRLAGAAGRRSCRSPEPSRWHKPLLSRFEPNSECSLV
jgi:hypothetical protein